MGLRQPANIVKRGLPQSGITFTVLHRAYPGRHAPPQLTGITA
jgi:hypothetical protein